MVVLKLTKNASCYNYSFKINCIKNIREWLLDKFLPFKLRLTELVSFLSSPDSPQAKNPTVQTYFPESLYDTCVRVIFVVVNVLTIVESTPISWFHPILTGVQVPESGECKESQSEIFMVKIGFICKDVRGILPRVSFS